MTNEAVKRYDESSGTGAVIQDYTIHDSVAVEKGAWLAYSGARVVKSADTPGQAIAGIAAREKVAGDGRTQISVYKKGYFDVKASLSGATPLGGALMYAHGNTVTAAIDDASGAKIIGYCDEAATNDTTFLMRLDL